MAPVEYYHLDAFNQTQGPFTHAELEQILRHGDVLVWHTGLKDWTLASQLPGFSPAGAALNPALIHEMLTLCTHILADGLVLEDEARELNAWIMRHSNIAGHWPGNVLAHRLRSIFLDGLVTASERHELSTLLKDILRAKPDPAKAAATAIHLPVDVPPPVVEFPGRSFCFAGRFLYGTPARCQLAVMERRGIFHDQPVWNTHYYVVGTLDIHPRIVKQIDLVKRHGGHAKIITEEHWAAHL
ncbi:MAG: hypothetical protein PCFJNLEI_02653 [Verrucomicrobiae bacterium]|nr:hypothetical protein [Verrucomicrobiae bacterium]